MATSRFENLRKALTAKIIAQFTTDGVSGVTVNDYRRLTLDREDNVWVGNIRGTQEPYTQGSGGFREEEMEVDVAIRCPQFGDTVAEFASAEQRAETIMASIETALRADIEVSSTVYNVEFAEYETNHWSDTDGAVGVIDITLTAEAHI